MSIVHEHKSPPSFEEATNLRQKARAVGLDPNHWYAVEHDSAIAKKQIVEVKFWGESVALYRDEAGRLHAIENRCAHRAVPLTLGTVKGDRIVCESHGWEYNGAGELADVPHSLLGQKMPECVLRTYPLRVRYGLVWMFFGDAERADSVPMPEIPELEGPNKWDCIPVDFTWKAHHSVIIEHVSDFTHELLHRKSAPFLDAAMTYLETLGDAVRVDYATKPGHSMKLGYEYPYQWSNTDDKIKHWLFVLPIDERTTRAFFLFYFDRFVVPFTSLRIPRRLMGSILRISNELLVKPLLSRDGRIVASEQVGYERHWDALQVEISPAVHEFQALTIRKWEEYLARERDQKEQRELVRLSPRQKLERADAEMFAAADGAEE